MADTRNFSKAEESVRKNPGQADAQAFEWERFIKTNAESSPEILSIKSKEEFLRWALEHPEKHVDPSIWEGKEISEYYYYLSEQHKNEPLKESEKKEPLKEVSEKPYEKTEVQHAHTNPQPSYITDAPAPTESQISQTPPSGRPAGGGINRGINTINNFAKRGLTNPFGKIGQRAAVQTALRGFSAFLASQVGLPILITLAFIVIFTIIIVGFGGVPPTSETSVQAPTPSAVTTLTPTPTPAAP